MKNTSSNNRALATFLANNREKDDIIAAVFDFLKLDCLERCNINPSKLDEYIRDFNQSEGCNIDVLTAIIDTIKIGQEYFVNKENELIKTIVSFVLEHLTEDISIEAMANELNISYYYMCHIFKNKYGKSISTFRTQN